MPSDTVKTFRGSSRFVSLSHVYVSPSVLPSNNLVTSSVGVMASLAPAPDAVTAAQMGGSTVKSIAPIRTAAEHLMQRDKQFSPDTSSVIRTSMHLSFDSTD